MSDPFIGQIAIFAFPFAPQGWAFCRGQLMPLSQNVTLYTIIGTNYGGDGKSTFALPNLQGVVAVGAGQGLGLSKYDLWNQPGGQATVALSAAQIPRHSHGFTVSTAQATAPSPNGNLLGRAWRALEHTDAVASFYSPNPNQAKTALAPNAVGPAGAGESHNNMQPYLALNFCIALQGVFPAKPS
jgi:microcystin-dependent protein